ncbi:MAG: endopeptidase La [Bacteroidaceae bacterium]|nr:endopeptidase La [Bacteroidaceae bacterium]
MSFDNNTQSPFSLIADFEGNIEELFRPKIGPTLPILPVRGLVLYPGVLASINVTRESSLKLLEQARDTEGYFGVVAELGSNSDAPVGSNLHQVGVVAKVMRTFNMGPMGNATILQGFGRFELGAFTKRTPFLRAKVTMLDEDIPSSDDKEWKAVVDSCRENTVKLIEASEMIPSGAAYALRGINNPISLVNFICTNLPFPIQEKVELLSEGNLMARATGLLAILNRELQYAQLKEQIQNKTREDLDKQHKEFFLRQQIQNIQSELGNEKEGHDAEELREKAKNLPLPEKVRMAFDKELAKLERMNPQYPDYTTQLTYLETIVDLPWGVVTEDTHDIPAAARILSRDHYGLERVKERILEYLAALAYSREIKSPIVCLVGPPGVGKTSLGRSIAESLGRKYVRVSLGGVHDEAEIRGHRRTYVGAMPGRIIQNVIKAGTENPVFVLDEIDKITTGSSWNGDPGAALLEVLDPEQNNAFHDNFLDIDYDLSKVLFIATANTLSTIPSALLDRMEVINVEGYLTEEKREIARRHLLPRHLSKYKDEVAKRVSLPPTTIDYIIEKYTRESGVRALEKQIEKILRKVAYSIVFDDGKLPKRGGLRPSHIKQLLGKPPYHRDKYLSGDYIGVVTGLAWTSVGGEILFIETALTPTKQPKLTLTGNLGDVMKESAMLALEYVKAHAATLGIKPEMFEEHAVHLHVPEGATPKDGPSAGITMATSIASAFTQRKVRTRLAMTGEITLRGKVLPVGGIIEIILASKRAGIRDIVISNDNKADIEEIQERYIEGLHFHFVDTVDEVLRYTLVD